MNARPGGEGDHSYCADLVRAGDPDRFACLMLLPPEARAHLCALYAFNLEVARTREAVREALLGEIRLQWWRDAIGECFDDAPRRHQVVQPLKAAIDANGLPRAMLERVVDARAADLYPDPPKDEKSLEKYVAETGGLIGVLAARCALGHGMSDEQSEAGRLAGSAWAWAGLARSMLLLRRQGRHIVPASWLEAYPNLEENLDAGRIGVDERTVTSRFAGQANSALVEFQNVSRSAAHSPDRHTRAIAKLTGVYLKRLKRARFDPSLRGCSKLGSAARAWHLLPISFSAAGHPNPSA